MRSKIKDFLCQIFNRIWKDIENTRWAIIIIIAYFAFLKIITGSTCPVVAIIGYPCPACGLTRAFKCLLRLDFSGALKIHAFIYAVILYLLVFFWNRYIRGQRAGKRLLVLGVVLIISMIVYYIWRMWMYFPGEPPVSYYYRNLWNMARGLIAGKG